MSWSHAESCGFIFFNHPDHPSLEELRGDVALTVSTMLACDVVLNAKHAGKQKLVCADVYKYMGATLGVTKRDLANISGKLVAQLQQFEEPQAGKKRSMGSLPKGQLACMDSAE